MLAGDTSTVESTSQNAKLEEVRLRLMERGRANREGKTSSPLTGELGDRETLRVSEELFRRAPHEFLTRTSVESMARIASEASKFFSAFLTSGKPFLVQSLNHPDTDERARLTSFFSAVVDRPFIVDTVSEFMRVRGLRVHCLLHPILHQPDGRRISLIYLEVDRVEEEARLKELTAKLESYLNDLVLVTDDFASMLVRVETSARILEGGTSPEGVTAADAQEAGDFLRWLADGGFVFLGFREWELDPRDPKRAQPTEGTLLAQSNLGLFRSPNPQLQSELADTSRDAAFLLSSDGAVLYSKILTESTIHRHMRMDLISVRSSSPDGKLVRVQCFLGLLTSKALAQEASSVPIIRRKLKKIIELEGALPNSHDYKHIVSIVDSKPKFKLLRYDVPALRQDIQMIMGLGERGETRVGLQLDPLKRYFFVLVVMASEKFSQSTRQQIQNYLETELGVPLGSSEYRLAVTDDPYLRVNFLIPNPTLRDWPLDIEVVRNRILEITTDWSDRLQTLLTKDRGAAVASRLTQYYSRAFPEDYRVANSPAQACDDIQHLERLTAENPFGLSLMSSSHQPNHYELRIFKRSAGLTLSRIVPLLENVDLEVATEYTNHLGRPEAAWAAIYELRVRLRSGAELDMEHARRHLLPNLSRVLLGQAENDRLNSLFVTTPLDWREVAFLRTVLRYIWQIQGVSSRFLAAAALVAYPESATLLWEAFRTKFDPSLFKGNDGERHAAGQEIQRRFVASLRQVKMLAHDRFLRAAINVVDATVRTNYFQSQDSSDIAFKIACKTIQQMRSPRPLYEIFVNAPDLEGVHLRSSRTARGGLRHSDRHEDFRTEVLGLMKTQVVKNSIIVPSGAKGGFVIKTPTGEGETRPVKEYYRRFVRCLVEVTDNISDSGEIIPPQQTIRYDENDPYLVVAADKGTATFSDFANEIAQKDFGFWLGDAFASGGSNGYDHKKLGITARGAWETVRIRFYELGMDCDKNPFTAVGVGDMSGDVFGNGFLRTETVKLIGAFNHKHIFIDPNPDPKRSFKERQRLFNLTGSQWSDYDRALISKGGGIFDRADKEITLSDEARAALGTEATVLSGEEVIKAILRAPVDLLWNGGIGTYVKASFEDHNLVGDRTNDDVRVDATEVRAKIIGEGGNLGFTQLARVEFAQRGGLVNTDAVDNSGGVDMSDHEVNLKILLREPVKRGALSETNRNALLASLDEEVADEVLQHNHAQAVALALDSLRSAWHLPTFQAFVKKLDASRRLDRRGEFLPSDDAFTERGRHRAGLTRPELAVLIAYAKITVRESILQSDMPDAAFTRDYLFNYFPKALREQHPQAIERHPLSREITAAQIANDLVDLLGSVSVFRLTSETGATERDVIAAYVVAANILELDSVVLDLRAAESPGRIQAIYGALIGISSAVEDLMGWLLVQRTRCPDWDGVLSTYREALRQILSETARTENRNSLNQRVSFSDLEKAELSRSLIERISGITELAASLDVVTLAVTLNVDVPQLLQLRRQLAQTLRVDELLSRASQLDGSDSWEDSALRSVLIEVRQSETAIIRSVVTETQSASPDGLGPYLEKRRDLVKQYHRSLEQLAGGPLTLAALVVLSTQLRQLATLR